MNDIATLTPPKGWKVLNDSQKQQFINEHLGGVDDIIAIAVPDGGDGSVFAQLSYRPAGYIRQGISEDLDILNQESGLTGSEAVRWKSFAPAPKYDNASRCVEYGVELNIGQDPALNLYKMCLVRNGALVLTLVGKPGDGLSLQGWRVTPQDSLRYERFDPKSDPRAEGTIINLLLMNRFI